MLRSVKGMTEPIGNNQIYEEAWLNERAEYFSGVYEDLLELRFRGVFQNKRIAIVGAWNNADEVNRILVRLGLTLNHIADNNPIKQGVSRLGIISQSVESLAFEKELFILVINNSYWKAIQNQLIGLGYVEGRDFCTIYGGEKFRLKACLASEALSPTEAEWEEYKLRARLAYESYVEYREKYKGLPIWLMHQPSLGDLYIFSLFLPHAMGVNSIPDCDCLLIVTKNSVKKLAVALGYKHVEIITFEEADRNWLTLMRLMGEHLDVYNAVYHGLSDTFQSLVYYSKISFRDSFTKYVFQFKDEVEPIYPVFPKRKDHILEQFREYGLIPGKTVILSPYAGHFIAQIEGNHWGRLIEELKAKGYTVCTNCGNPEEQPLPDTESPLIELQDCVEFVETAGYFIGVRSGFCDLVCMAQCLKIVIYETGAPAASIDYFGFKSMGIGDVNIVELVNDCIHTDNLIKQILEYF